MNKKVKKFLYGGTVSLALLAGAGITAYANGFTWRDNITSIRRTIDELSATAIGQKSQLEKLEEDYQAKKSDVDSLTQEVTSLEAQNRDLANSYEALRVQYTNDMASKDREILAKIQEIQDKIAEGQAKYNEVSAKLNEATQALAVVTQERDIMSTELSAIKAQVKETDDYGKQKLEEVKR